MKIFKKILNVFSYILMAIILFFIVFAIVKSSKGEEISIFGYKMYVIKTDSMEPTIEVDSVILVKEYDEVILDKGSIITFRFTDKVNIPNTHRIVGYYYEYLDEFGEVNHKSSFDYNTSKEFYQDNKDCKIVGYRTQGDNPKCEIDLKPVLFSDIYGVYQKELVVVSFLYGLLTNFLGFLIIILVPLFILLVLQIISIYKLRQKNKLETEIKNEEEKRKEIEERLKREAIEEYLKNKK